MLWIVGHRRAVKVPSMRWALSFGLIALAAVFGTGPAFAQSYRPGQPIEYKAANWPERWARGVFVREIPGGTQVLIREEPTQFFPEGSQRAYARADVRPVAGASAAPAQARGATAQPVRPRAAPAPEPRPAPGGAPIAGTGRGGPMSQQEVLAFLRERLGSGDPFANPRREAVLQALRGEILRRGVDFHNHAIGDFANQIGRYGALSNVHFALNDNFGPPANRNELYGTWRLIQVGATTTVSRGNNLYQRQEYAGLAGSLTVNAGGTYVWNSPSGPLRGNWRPATAAEMAQSDKGGEGVVLLNARNGADWLVHKRTEEGPEGTGIMIRDLATRNQRVRGTR